MNKAFFSEIRKYLVAMTTFLFPLFFLPVTQEFFITNKFYLLCLTALLLLVLTLAETLLSKRIEWSKNSVAQALVMFTLAVGISTFFVSPNRVQALLNPHLNLLTVISLVIFYLQAVRTDIYQTVVKPLMYSSALVSILALITLFFHPFQGVTLPFTLQFLANPSFTPVGSLLDLAILLGFTTLLAGGEVYADIKKQKAHRPVDSYLILGLTSAAFITVVYFILKNQFFTTLPPLTHSWYAGLEVLKKPLTALLGAGIDNFSAVFTRVKDIAYNQTLHWQTDTFLVSRSALLHILTETGLVGATAFILVVIAAIKQTLVGDTSRITAPVALVLSVVALMVLPPSLVLFFVFFVSLMLVHRDYRVAGKQEATVSIDTRSALLVLLPLSIVVFLGVLYGSFRLGTFYLADYNMRKSVEGIAKNDLRELYDHQRQAIALNPDSESYHLAFARTNAVLAENLADTLASAEAATGVTTQQREVIAQAMQAAIDEAKAAIALNDQKAVYWETLASLYRNIITAADGADAWTISSYQRAITLDPTNPRYRLDLGGVYYSVGNYAAAQTLFEQAAALKPDWSNAHYNLAWTAYQQKDYTRAVTEMEEVIRLTDPVTRQADYEKAQEDLAHFRSTAGAAGP